MFCNECLEYSRDGMTLSGNYYCIMCINKYLLRECPGSGCNNIISLNGFDDLDDTDENTCKNCDTIYCNDCLIRDTNILLCNDCFNS